MTPEQILRAKLRLLNKAQSKTDSGVASEETPADIDHFSEVWGRAKYTGTKHTDLQMIGTKYPNHEIIVEMYGGPVFTVDTDRWGVNMVDKCYESLDAYMTAHGLSYDDMDGVYRANDIFVPGAKTIYYMEM